MSVETLLIIIAVLLFMVFWELLSINRRLKNQFPTESEQDYEWSQKDPMGHWEAHKNDEKKAQSESGRP